ncbi:MAG: class I SAM-dependent methyltransferase [Alysiella sp.]|uniref:class I SAM-dependent methyltransferase n=1 Tax=Alysiella sp. TaxID=1872483 RepID=UPI0026DCCEE1|nr:class I SAM-dependent methyltransferase [Alysiella sp.]MDO4433938.1 class I SAM-dependent methyltransferase [Alysiella sp.]
MLSIYAHHILPEYLNDLPFEVHINNRLPESGVYLFCDEHGVSLCKVGKKGKVQVDFVGGAAEYRRTKGGGELIGKAVNHSSQPIVWDATGGLGRDAFVLASLGLKVDVFEQDERVFALLYDGIMRALSHRETAEIMTQINLHYGNAVEKMHQYCLQKPDCRPDVVYLDPMYPDKQKSAAVKKEMAYFHELLGLPENTNDAALFQAAREIAKKRVVVKRPRLGRCLCDEKPAYQYVGKSTRFDVYLPL